MKKLYFLLCIFIVNLLLFFPLYGKESKYFTDAKKLYHEKNFEDSKFLFEKDIVFNPKNEKSYLYLAKIFNKNNNDEEQEINLNSVLLLNPQNDEAIYMLTMLKIKQSNYDQAKKLIKKFELVCKSFCSKKNEIEEQFKKLIPENAKSNN